ncbi:ABC transporter permease [Acanthopleuribacter pedis]|uniref:ABC transporter permease n=1 Tax=Acanthopleuribacter pedis TaxID=442870 RepID=A0A8J7U770_9BACT|nr:ABC transporter permease [Acanthopleuribacter pedis]MBO1322183.1 ABC transporter permease [Acanthopleuribacter pedis]
MNMIPTIVMKELTEITRDRKTLFFMLALPTFVMPLLFYGVFTIAKKMAVKERDRILRVAVIGEGDLNQIRGLYADENRFELLDDVNQNAVKTMIRNEELDAAVVVPANYLKQMADGFQVEIPIQFTGASQIDMVFDRVSEPLYLLSEELSKQRLSDLGVTFSLKQQAVLQPLVAKKDSLASSRERYGEQLGAFLPYIFIIFTFVGAIYPASDLGAGEKERITLETLLLSPVNRVQLVLGKYLVVALAGVVSAVLSIISTSASMVYFVKTMEGGKVQELAGFLGSIDTMDFVQIGLLILPLAAIFAAVLLAISIYAKSYKESQTYLMPVQYIVLVPVILSTLPGMKLSYQTALIPLLNVSLASKEIIKGTIDPLQYVLIFVSTLVIAVLGIIFCTKWFQREDVLFRN